MHLKLHIFPYPSIKTCALGAQKNRLIKTDLLSSHNICFSLRNKKNNFTVRTFIWRPEIYLLRFTNYYLAVLYTLRAQQVQAELYGLICLMYKHSNDKIMHYYLKN